MTPTPDQIRQAIEASGRRYSQAARAMGISADKMRKLMIRYQAQGEAFPSSRGSGGTAAHPGWEPTEAEIAAACEEFQAGWSETAKRQRSGKVGEDVEIPRIELPTTDSARSYLNETW